jgi:serine/threonine protein kinase
MASTLASPTWHPEFGGGLHAEPKLESYDLVREAGRGASAVVYEVRHRGTGRPVALKVLAYTARSERHSVPSGRFSTSALGRSSLGWRDSSTVASLGTEPEGPFSTGLGGPPSLNFEAEARAIGRLACRHIVALEDAGVLPTGEPFLALEWCAGGTAEAALPVDEVFRLAEHVLLALAFSHAAGVVHRDVKPSNILRGADGRWRLSDFGIAALIEETDARLAGTPAYIAPEVVDPASFGPIGPAADLYSLGATLWQLFTGVPLYLATPERMLTLHGQAPIGTFEPSEPVPDGTEAWLRTLLAAQPADRPACAAEALRSLLALHDQTLDPARIDGLIEGRDPSSDLGIGAVRFREPPLLGRDASVDAVSGWAQRTSGRRLVVVRGPEGSGRRAFATHVIRMHAARGEWVSDPVGTGGRPVARVEGPVPEDGWEAALNALSDDPTDILWLLADHDRPAHTDRATFEVHLGRLGPVALERLAWSVAPFAVDVRARALVDCDGFPGALVNQLRGADPTTVGAAARPSLLEAGREAYAMGSPTQAAGFFRAALDAPDLDPATYGELSWRLALALGRLGDTSAMQSILDTWPDALRVDAGACYADALEARIRQLSGAPTQDADALLAALRTHLPDAEKRIPVVTWLLNSWMHDTDPAWLLAVVEAELRAAPPDTSRAKLLVSRASLRSLGPHDSVEVLSDFDEAFAIIGHAQGHYANWTMGRADILARIPGRLDDAIEAMRDGIARFDGLPVLHVLFARLTLAGWLLQKGHYAEVLEMTARFSVDRLAEADGARTLIALLEAVARAGLGQFDAASEAWSRFEAGITSYWRRDPHVGALEALYAHLRAAQERRDSR